MDSKQNHLIICISRVAVYILGSKLALFASNLVMFFIDI